jgi:hypothetical protein
LIKLPESLREYFGKPHGKLYEGSGEELYKQIEEVKEARLIACVGDVVSYFALKASIEPDIVIFDAKTKREEVDQEFLEKINSLTENYAEIEVSNPQAVISLELVEGLVEAVSTAERGERVKIFVRGEEDLATMPLIAILPENSVILYGMPGRGVIALEITRDKKLLILDVLQKMEKGERGEEIINIIRTHAGR